MSTKTKFIWDDDNLLAEADGTNTTNTVYTNEPEQYGNLISSRISGSTSYHHFDAVGSTRQLSNPGGSTTDTMLYDAWGTATSRTGSTVMPFSWVGALQYYLDVELSALYVRERYVGPALARWTTIDPIGIRRIGDAVSMPYVYSRNSPIVRVDPSGLLSVFAIPQNWNMGVLKCNDQPQAQWRFRLDAAKHCDGYIIQRVKVLCSAKTCGRNPRPAGVPQSYWESWNLPDGQQEVVDTAAWAVRRPPSCGHYEQDGEVRFYCAADTGILEQNPKWQGQNEFTGAFKEFGTGVCTTIAGTLVATDIPGEGNRIWKKQPREQSKYRFFWVNFCCCAPARGQPDTRRVWAFGSPLTEPPRNQ